MNSHAPHRFLLYAPELCADGATLDIVGDEHHHASRVLRLAVDDKVCVTDGGGLLADATVAALDRHAVRLTVDSAKMIEKSSPEITLAIACLKKDALEQVVKQCTELGVDRFIVFASQRSHVSEYSPAFVARMNRVAVSAIKQSFRAYLPAITLATFDELVLIAQDAASVMVGAPGGDAVDAATSDVLVVVGPEPGLAAEEAAALHAGGASAVCAGEHRLRSETAAAALVALVAAPRRR